MLLENNLQHRLTSELILILNCDEDRSQLKNKEIVTKRFLDILKKVCMYRKNGSLPKFQNQLLESELKTRKMFLR